MTENVSTASTRAAPIHKNSGLQTDVLVAEQPLQLNVNGRRYAVLMRTPYTSQNSDIDLCTGFLLAEGMVEDWEDFRRIAWCTDRNNVHRENTVVAHLQSGCLTARDWARNRSSHSTAACGVCGIEDIRALMPPVPIRPMVPKPKSSWVQTLPRQLRARQSIFSQTGGIHGAAIFKPDGTFICVDEDIGRHNALDKVIGYCVRVCPTDLQGAVAVVSGRIGFELVQKALMAQMGTLVGVGAASSLAHDLSKAHGLHLFSFTKTTSVNYHSPE